MNCNTNYNKYNLDPKYIKCAGCPKPPGLRSEDGGHFSAYKGPNNTELCHKCARCYKCGKKEKWDCYRRNNIGDEWKLAKEDEDYGMLSFFEKDENNPSGGWYMAFCLDCKGFDKGVNHYESRYNSHYEYPYRYWKVDGVELGSENKRETERDEQADIKIDTRVHKGDNANKCRIAGCSQKAYYECMDLCLHHSKPCQGTRMGKKCNLALGSDEGNFCECCKNQTETYQEQKIKKGNNDDNQAKPIKVIVDKGNDKENNSPPNYQYQETPSKGNKEMLVIDLRIIKRIDLTSDGKLVIEFNNLENNNCNISQTITAEQVNNNQELQTIKNYCQQSGKSSLSRSELNNIFSTNNTNTGPTGKSADNNHALAIGISIAAALIFGLTIGLLLKRKKVIKRS